MSKKKTTEDFITESKAVHGDKYDYSLVAYTGRDGKVTIVCPEHGSFEQRAYDHARGIGCQQCGRIVATAKATPKKIGQQAHNLLTKDQFVADAIDVHGEKYTYENVVYAGSHVKVSVTCKEHGEFLCTPHNLKKGHGCPKCANLRTSA